MLSYLKTQSPIAYAYWSLGFLFCVGQLYFQSHPGGIGLQISFNAFSWIIASVFLGFSLFQIVHVSALFYSPLTLGLVAACGIILLPGLYPDSIDITSLSRFYGLIAGLLVFIGLQQLHLDQHQKAQLMFLLLIGISIQAVIGYAQHFGMIPDGVIGYSTDQRTAWGIFRQPNAMSSFMATGLVVSAFLLPMYVSETANKHKVKAVICLLMPLITIPIVVLLNARVGWAGVVVGSALMLPYLYMQCGKRITISWVIMGLLAIAVGMLLLATVEGGLAQATFKVQQDTIRSNMYPAIIRLILDNPVFGVGYGNFESAFNAFAANLYIAGIANPVPPNLDHPHNELLFWAAEGGIVALAGLLIAAYLVLASILRSNHGHRLALVGLLFPIVLHTQTEHPFYSSTIHWILFVMFIYLVDSMGNQLKKRQLKSTLLIGTAGIVIPVTTTLFMATTLHASAVLTRYENVPGTSIESLMSIVNPVVWRDRLMFTVRGNLMIAALANGDTSQVQPFIDLTEESIKSKPRVQRYQDLILLYDILNDKEMSDKYFKEGTYRFPTVKFNRLEEGSFQLLSILPKPTASAASK